MSLPGAFTEAGSGRRQAAHIWASFLPQAAKDRAAIKHLVTVQRFLKRLTAEEYTVKSSLYKLDSLAAATEYQCLLCMAALPGPHTEG